MVGIGDHLGLELAVHPVPFVGASSGILAARDDGLARFARVGRLHRGWLSAG